MRMRKLFRYSQWLVILIGISFILNPVQAQSRDIVYILVEPQVAPVASANDAKTDKSTSPVSKDPYIIQIRNTDIAGFVFPDNSTITIYSNSKLYAEVYGIIPDAPTGGYRFSQPDSTIATSSSDQNVFNQGFSDHFKQFKNINVSNLLATRPITVLGGIEAVIVGDGGKFDSRKIQGAYALVFENFSFQVLQLGGSKIELGIPSIGEGKTFTLITNKDMRLDESIIFADGTELPGTGGKAYPRDSLIKLLGFGDSQLFKIMDDWQIRIYPYGGLTFTYRPQSILILNSTDEQPYLRSFRLEDNIRPIKGSKPHLRLAEGGGVFGNGILTGAAKVRQIDENGQLVIRQNGAQADEIVDAWLVEVPQ